MVFEKGQPFAMRERDALWISLGGKLLLMFARHWATALASKLVGFNMIRSDTMCGCCALADVASGTQLLQLCPVISWGLAGLVFGSQAFR